MGGSVHRTGGTHGHRLELSSGWTLTRRTLTGFAKRWPGQAGRLPDFDQTNSQTVLLSCFESLAGVEV